MPRGPGKRVVMNRAAIDAIRLGYADGMQEVGEAILARAEPHVPDEPPIGKGLVQTGAAVTYVDGQKVAGRGTMPRSGRTNQGIMTAVGYGFPGRFNEVGTVHQPARPFLTPAIAAEVRGGMGAIPRRILRRLANVRRHAT